MPSLARSPAISARPTRINANSIAERQKIASDQDRIRKNLASTGSSSDLGRHYLDTLKSQEDRLTAIATEEKAIEQEIAGKMKEAEGVAQALVL